MQPDAIVHGPCRVIEQDDSSDFQAALNELPADEPKSAKTHTNAQTSSRPLQGMRLRKFLSINATESCLSLDLNSRHWEQVESFTKAGFENPGDRGTPSFINDERFLVHQRMLELMTIRETTQGVSADDVLVLNRGGHR